MMNFRKIGILALALPLAFSIAFTPEIAEARNKKDNVAIGIGLGLLGGALVSRGDPMAAIGGAVAGGVIGGAVSKDRRAVSRDRRHDRREWRHDYRRHHYDRRDHRR